MSAKEIAAVIAASARATLCQVPGVDPAMIDRISDAIANNAAMVLALALDTES